MSDAPVVSLLDQFRQQHAAFIQQRDQAQVNFQQLVGAIFACEQMILKLVEAEKAPKEPAQGESDGQAIDEGAGEAAQE